MYLTRLVYTSTISDIFKSDDIEEILLEARKYNEKSNVTGMLCFNSKYFLQCLEGSRLAVNQTYHKILNDKRHSNIVMLDYKEIDAREFNSWSMGYLPESSLTAPINLKYSGNTAFNPYEMSGESAQLMMLSLRNSIPSV
jgi:hypothetical protein